MRQAPGQQQGGDDSLDFLWLMAMIVVSIGLIWYFGRDYITAFDYQVKLYEIIAIKFVVNGWNDLAAMLPLPVINIDKLYTWEGLIRNHALGHDFGTVKAISTDVGRYYSYPVALVLLILGIFVYTKNVGMKFTKMFNMKKLKLQESADWPQIVPIINVDLVKQDLDKGPWAMSLTPTQFCKKYNLIKEERDDDERVVAKLIRGAAYDVFVMQLGPLWTSIDSYPTHTKALFAAFAAFANQDRENADKLLKQIANSVGTGKLNFNGAQQLLEKHLHTKIVQRVTQLHAYMLTIMASMLELARTDGVVACSEFLWLKTLDRRLWYVLNSVGRQTPVPEAAGVFAHWITEKRLGRPLRIPMVDEAVNGLETALNEIIYEPEEN